MSQRCKYVVLIGDGMADRPLPQLKGKTPLEAAKIPNMNWIARNGICGFVRTVPKGVKPGSDVANLSVLGYDPRECYTGRGPLEALSRGIKLGKNDVAFRCNLVKIENGRMADYSAGHISTKEAKKTIELLQRELGNDKIRFYPGVSYRHLVIIDGGPNKVKCTPPHDITGRPISKYLPKGPGADTLNILMSDSYEILSSISGKACLTKPGAKRWRSQANMIWLWGQGKTPKMKKFPLKGSVITAVDLLKGIGKAIGLKAVNVPGATGYLDTNYIGKAKYALASLKNGDFVFVHVESPDEAGHEGNIKHKIKAIQDFDKYVVGTVLKGLKRYKNYKLMVLPDHPTPISIKTHSGEPVPFAIYSSMKKIKGADAYNEKSISRSKLRIEAGHKLMDFFIRQA
jgi:2,3-bisphosphoglycerate-independent phosphoglycerate mutase